MTTMMSVQQLISSQRLIPASANSRYRCAQTPGVVASFSRALMEGLSVQQTDAEFNATLEASIQRIYDASITWAKEVEVRT